MFANLNSLAILQAEWGGAVRMQERMDSAQTSLPWIDWQCLQEGVNCRNQVAYEGRLLGDKECLERIADIEAQLIAWGVITETEQAQV